MHGVSTKWNVVGQQVMGIENMVAFRGQVPTNTMVGNQKRKQGKEDSHMFQQNIEA